MDDLVLNAAYMALLASTFTRTVQRLRLLLVAGAVCFIAYGLAADVRSIVAWNIVIGSMHLFRVVRDLRVRRSVQLTANESVLRDRFFPELSDFDFNLLWTMGERVVAADETLIGPGNVPESVSLVLSGSLTVSRDGGLVATVGPGGLLGEMSFVSGQPAEVLVTADGGVVLHRWNQRELSSLDQVRPASARAFHDLLSRDLVGKARR